MLAGQTPTCIDPSRKGKIKKLVLDSRRSNLRARVLLPSATLRAWQLRRSAGLLMLLMIGLAVVSLWKPVWRLDSSQAGWTGMEQQLMLECFISFSFFEQKQSEPSASRTFPSYNEVIETWNERISQAYYTLKYTKLPSTRRFGVHCTEGLFCEPCSVVLEIDFWPCLWLCLV